MLVKAYPARTLKDIERAITHPDLDKELALAAMKRYYQVGNDVVIGWKNPKRRGSAMTPVGSELIYGNVAAGTAKNTFTTEFQINDTAGMGPAPIIPQGFFLPAAARGKALRIVTRGICSVTGTPTWIWTHRFNPTLTPANPPTGANVGSNAAATALTGVTNQLWEAEIDVQCVTEGAAGANSTFRGLGTLFAAGLFASAATLSIFAGGASPGTVATVDISTTNTFTLSSTCSASSASNSIQLLQLLIFGLN